MKKLFLALPILLAGCQSGRVAFQFQPAAPTVGTVGAAPAYPATLPPTASVPAKAGEASTEATRMPLAARIASGNAQRLRSHAGSVAPPARASVLALAGELVETSARPPRPGVLAGRRLGRQRATAGPARTAESGLGNIALFFIAVVLGILAGLGALVSLIPGVSFIAGVGLAAAGLLVLFLLYSLLSGGGKKKK